MSKIVSITTDGASNTVWRSYRIYKAFHRSSWSFHSTFSLRYTRTSRSTLPCAKVGLKELIDMNSIVTKVVNLISAQALHKREFTLLGLLRKVNSVYDGLYNNVRWLSRGKVLERFVECINEIKLFLSMKNNKDFLKLDHVAWLSCLMFFADLSIHLRKLNVML